MIDSGVPAAEEAHVEVIISSEKNTKYCSLLYKHT